MKAIWYTRQGPPKEVVQFGEQPEPHAATGEVRIRLQASGVNPADIYRRAGPNFQMDGPLIIPNSDGAGVVDEHRRAAAERDAAPALKPHARGARDRRATAC